MSRLVELGGVRYRVSLAPVERPEHAFLGTPQHSVCFETEDGRWVGFTTIYYALGPGELEAMSHSELEVLLRQAQCRG